MKYRTLRVLVVVIASVVSGCGSSEADSPATGSSDPDFWPALTEPWTTLTSGRDGSIAWTVLTAPMDSGDQTCMGWTMRSDDPTVEAQIRAASHPVFEHDGSPFACAPPPGHWLVGQITPLVREELPGTGHGLVAGLASELVDGVSMAASDGSTAPLQFDGRFFWGIVPMETEAFVITTGSDDETCAMPHLFEKAAIPWCEQ